ncbi:TetR/AcrR family transcriptional regulator [Leptospira perdikensis]|uniref:TetR/AcrR family transcriptional regulator n=1 Tax=Leptospira perdikensis TaxID=2484948 RepID=A0A4R9J4M0_9LEPT|nr:TetR/AcrR family transcriptional regulator [Leptospira perdikensis]TGL33399.1 TetR/AcrR family transcriptional regulator [Leptospira perdikensis]
MKEKIIQTALRICERDGYESFSMRKLATKLDLDPMAVYHYFENKEALTKAMVEQIFNRFQKKISKTNKNPKINLKKILTEYWNLFIEYPGMSLYLIKNSHEDFPSVITFNQTLRDLIRDLHPGKEIEKVLYITIDFIHGNAFAHSSILNGKTKGEKIRSVQKVFESTLSYLLDLLSKS